MTTLSGLPLFDYVDVCARRHRGSPESRAANLDRRAHAAEQRARVHRAIIDAGAHGITADELAERWKVGPNAISGRFTELCASGVIVASGHRLTRAGSRARVWREAQ